ncbi:GNAT family N-acetyltransferase [Shewanella woodyi]|uniref:GNAT family N-acetyltransferase n=1 Tax=Shewanella woodyi TaxID=60961 RepID=UPI0007EAFB48|nr:GNAT family N-acetyltransferase [Shewanella woodyi]
MINIRAATIADTCNIWALRTKAISQACLSHYPKEVVKQWAASPMPSNFAEILISLHAIVAEDIGENKQSTLLGFGFIDKEQGRLESLFVDPKTSRKGVGKLIATALISSAQQANLTQLQLSSTLNAVNFYQSLGFISLEQSSWQHPSGFELASVSMSKQLI